MSARTLASLFCIALIWPSLPTTSFGFSGSRPTLEQSAVQEPRDCYRSIVSLVEASSGDAERVTLLTALAEISWDYGRRDEALRFLNQAAEIGHFNEPGLPIWDKQAEQMARNITAACAKLGFHDRALSIAGDIRNDRERAWQLVRIAESMTEAGLREKALITLSRAYEAIAPPKDEGGVLSGVARAFAAAGAFDSAERMAGQIKKAITYFLQLQTLAYIAIDMAKAGQSQKAEGLIDKTLQATLQMKPYGPSDDGKPKICALLANAYGELGLKDRASNLLSMAEEMAKKIEADLSVEQIVGSYARLGQMSKARSLASTIAYRPSMADSQIEIARAYLKANERRSAIELLEESFTLSKAIRRELDTFKIERLIAIATEFTHSDQRDRANEVLIYALKEASQSEHESRDQLVKTLRGYAQLGVALDEEACSLVKRIVSGEPIPLTAGEVEKQKLAERAANHFIKRWHETFDLNILFDELYISSPKQRQRNTLMFYGVYKFLAGSVGPAVDKDVDDGLMRKGFFAFWTMSYLVDEYRLAYQESKADLEEPTELKRKTGAAPALKLSDKRMVRRQVEQFVALATRTSSVYRKYLTAEVFNSPRYLQNVKLEESSRDTYEKRFRIVRGLSEFGVPNEVEVYYLRRGVFDFYFLEENGKLRVLTLGFEL